MNWLYTEFKKYLLELGFSDSTANNYPCYLKKIARKNRYKDLYDLAKDVFILLDQGKHGERKFDEKLLAEIKKNKSVLTLFNGFLFDIDFKRDFVVPCSRSTNYIGILSTDQMYIPGKQPRTLIDKDRNGKPTNKEYFSIYEVMDALHITEKTLKRWDDYDKKGILKEHFPHRYKGNTMGNINLSTTMSKTGIYGYYYYRLDELNAFLDYQFRKGTPEQKKRYMSDQYKPNYTKKCRF